MSLTVPANIVGQLREAIVRLKSSKIHKEIVEPRDGVLTRFQPIFSAEHIPALTEEEFRSFLLIENNKHWSGLHRQGPRMCADMERLRKALIILTDEERPLAERLDESTNIAAILGNRNTFL